MHFAVPHAALYSRGLVVSPGRKSRLRHLQEGALQEREKLRLMCWQRFVNVTVADTKYLVLRLLSFCAGSEQ